MSPTQLLMREKYKLEDLAGLGIPRSYSFPYSKEKPHEKISKALVNLKNGIPQMGEQLKIKRASFLQ